MTSTKKIILIVIAVIVGSGVIYAVSPYFTNTTIDEASPIAGANQEMMVQKMTTSSGSFIGVGDGIHDAEGRAFVLSLDDGTKYLRFEDFKATNGPDLYVYLSTDEQASDFVNLGRLKANMGNQNYEIPSEVNLSKYSNVLIWCKAFSVLFGSAELG
jgi:hypothetical protein